jgi:mono/diheme cytochrome c family protein
MQPKDYLMRFRRLLGLFLVLSVSRAVPAFAQDGAATFKAKCAACHGPEGQGNIGPAVKGTSLTADQIVALVTIGDQARKPPHKKPRMGVSVDEAKAAAEFVKSLK